jgi:aspartate aminotransferase-like enzyme
MMQKKSERSLHLQGKTEAMAAYTFKIAAEAWEFEQIKALNYETFVEEIAQHVPNPRRSLTDAFHDENTYLICVHGRQVLAMLAVRGKRPFSLDRKLDNLDAYLPEGGALCEVRLLAVRKNVRHSRIVRGLLAETVRHCVKQGYDTALISGILEQVNLYRHLGFVPFGPVVGTNGARFQPMYLTIEGHATAKSSFLPKTNEPVNLLPGPLRLSRAVREALMAAELSHRSEAYMKLHHQTQRMLCELTGAQKVQMLMGSGTLANDVIAGQLSILDGKGLVLSNGEFGERLIEQARCFGLSFETLSLPWAKAFEPDCLQRAIDSTPGLRWLWAVCSESSTGMLNDPDLLKSIAGANNLRLCLDCVSAIGSTPVDLKDVYLASACSSKGLGSAAGLAMVFYHHVLNTPGRPLPVYLDLHHYEVCKGVPFTISSNLVEALHAALKTRQDQAHFERVAALDKWLRAKLTNIGLPPLVTGRHACPGVITIDLNKSLSSRAVGDRLRQAGVLVSYESKYLLERNWIQICLMSEISKSDLRGLIEQLKDTCD